MYTHTHIYIHIQHTYIHKHTRANTRKHIHTKITPTNIIHIILFTMQFSTPGVGSSCHQPNSTNFEASDCEDRDRKLTVFEDQDKRNLYKYKDSVRTSQRIRCRHTFIRKSDPRILCGKIVAVRNTQNITNTLCGHNTNGTTMLYRVNDMQDVCFRLCGYNLCYIPFQLSPRTGPAIYGMNVLLVSGNHLLYNIHCPQLVRRYDVKKLSSGTQ